MIFVVVGALLVYALVRFRQGRGRADREPPQVYGSTRIELAWTIVPVLIVVILVAATARVVQAIQDASAPPDALEFTVVGHQFWWEYRCREPTARAFSSLRTAKNLRTFQVQEVRRTPAARAR